MTWQSTYSVGTEDLWTRQSLGGGWVAVVEFFSPAAWIHRYWGERGAELLVLQVPELLFPCPWTPAPARYQVQTTVSMVTYRMCYGVNSFEGGMAPLQEGKDGMGEKISLPKQCRRAICILLSLWRLYIISFSDYRVYRWNTSFFNHKKTIY